MTTTEAVGLIGTYLEIKNILHGLEFLLVSLIELLERLLFMSRRIPPLARCAE